MQDREIDEGTGYTGFEQALSIVCSHTGPAAVEELQLALCPGLVSAEDVGALVDSPPRNSSLKDGFAVIAGDTAHASSAHPVSLKLAGSIYAGGSFRGKVNHGEAVRVCTGAPVPEGTDAVVADELCEEEEGTVRIRSGVTPGKNIIPAGEDVSAGNAVIARGDIISPAALAYAAAAGVSAIRVYRRPKIALVSIGDELVEPGIKLEAGKIYASNSVHTGAWLSMYNIPFTNYTIPDDAGMIKRALREASEEADALITGGGVMHSERDLTIGILDDLGWDMKFRHVRMGPGKATAFGLWDGKPVFCFSGGPTSNGVAFLQFGLAGIFNMMGYPGSPLTITRARLTQDIKSRNRTWTEFREGSIVREENGLLSVTPLSGTSRLKSMVEADCLICKPEGVGSLKRDETVAVQLLRRFIN